MARGLSTLYCLGVGCWRVHPGTLGDFRVGATIRILELVFEGGPSALSSFVVGGSGWSLWPFGVQVCFWGVGLWRLRVLGFGSSPRLFIAALFTAPGGL